MTRRLELHSIFLGMTPNVYFQPPENLKMVYPCIRYERDFNDVNRADNLAYNINHRWKVTLIYTDPDTELVDEILKLRLCAHATHFVASNLIHDVFSLYF